MPAAYCEGQSEVRAAEPERLTKMETATCTAEDLRAGYRVARTRGCEYLLKQLRSDGGFGPEERGVADYYKVAMALSACGETRAAHGLCHWIRKHGMSPDGGFGPRPEEDRGYCYAYYNASVILGA